MMYPRFPQFPPPEGDNSFKVRLRRYFCDWAMFGRKCHCLGHRRHWVFPTWRGTYNTTTADVDIAGAFIEILREILSDLEEDVLRGVTPPAPDATEPPDCADA